jgi:hypothetical protein
MPMIVCKECGSQISNLSKFCIKCGAPTLMDTSVKIKIIPFLSTHLMMALPVKIIDSKGKLLWSGPSGTVAVFNIDEPTSISIIPTKGLHTPTNGIVSPGKRYQIRNDLTKLGFFKSKTLLVEVDVIDSD